MKKPNGIVLYKGASLLTGDPIVVIATGLSQNSSNRKTGGMIQTYIIRSDVDPISAIKSGADRAICFDCPHRGDGTGKGRTCYVNLGQGPLAVYRAFRAGKYPMASRDNRDLLNGQSIRFGTYGDPAACPASVWHDLARRAKRWTGYTHQWRRRGRHLKQYCMASCDTDRDLLQARAAGWRTFRVSPSNNPGAGEILCPASKEAGNKTQCARCGLCAGASKLAASIMIPMHGGFAQMANAGRLADRLAARESFAI